MSGSLLLAFSIISTSFLGSWHCAAMCGPIATLMSHRKSMASYHLGRLLSYSVLGGLGGYLGQFFLNSQFVTLRWISAILMAGFLFYLALTKFLPATFRPQHGPLAGLIEAVHRSRLVRSTRSGFAMGVLTAFLPCGWLYTYVLAAMATGSAWSGLIVMVLFWLGGLPVLYSAPELIKKLISGTPVRNQRIAGIILLFSSFYSLGVFMLSH